MIQSKKYPKVSLVGAGPGSKDLITRRGFRVLQNADAILYDALIDKSLLDEVAGEIPKIYVGKRCGKHLVTQEKINRLLVECAFNYGHVVRLKGGDPFVFGRASEEIAHVESFGIPVEVVPGVSSAIAVPGNQGIPLTQRGIATSFWVMTATKSDGTFSEDLKWAAQSSSTMVILMGVRKFVEIAREIIKYRSGATPVALIQNGTLKNESYTIGTLDQAEILAKSVDVSLPGIIIVGDVVAEHPSFFEDEIQRVLRSAI
ncbi:uroporphyrinogen-III C-methyltransferase [Spongiimicrobium salis]|uniref:uroporphyrinogen-III C-methyltransferase n=1 Tax=Spongiimicrobium salis TaxID=1667022 RepID=UPI00374D93BA